MKCFLVAGGERGRLSSPRLFLLLTSYYILFADGQQLEGVSLQLLGQTLPNNSLVSFEDLVYQSSDLPGFTEAPTNANGRQTLMCVTDLVDCCETEALGNWYYPDGRIVTAGSGATFRTNRGQNEEINGQQFNGSVRIWRYFTPSERGVFYCKLPDAENVTQTLYVNILFFQGNFYNGSYLLVFISPSGSTTAGETYSLTCSATLNSRNPPLPHPDIPFPIFEWFFGLNGNAPLPSGLTPTPTVLNSLTYTSTLQFSPLSQSHTGMYTCRLGAGSLVNSAVVIVNAPTISVEITTSGALVLGQNGYSLTCSVNGTNHLHPSITYQWTKNNGTQTQIQVGTDKVLSFSPLRLSDAGRYTCQATVSSPYLNINITRIDTEDITLQIPAPTSVMLSSSPANPIPPFSGSDVTLICTTLSTSQAEIDVALNVTFELLRTNPARSPLTTATPSMSGSTYITTAVISSFGRNDSGVYTCRATVSSASTYMSDSNTESDSLRVTTGVYLALRGAPVANNSNINIRNVGQSSDNPNGALQCITDKIPCCSSQNPRIGEWYLPGRILISGGTSTRPFYRNRGDNGQVSLNRPSDTISPTGLFCCEIPDATNTTQTLCVNIGGLSITSTPSDPPTAGENYTLECSAGGSGGTFQWLGPPDGRTSVDDSHSNLNIMTSTTSSQLQFRPIGQSDNGSYSCSATVGRLALSSEPVLIVVNAPSVSVQIGNIVSTPTAGENYLLTCTVSGAENLSPTIVYRWSKNSGSGKTQVGTNSNTLFFTPLQLSDAASYDCEVTISSTYLSGNVMATDANPHVVRIQIPTPPSLTLTSSGGNTNIVTVGTDVILTCTLGLNSAIVASDLSLLTVDAQLFRGGTLLSNHTMSPVTGTTLTYSTQLNSFGRSDSGNYICSTTIRPQPFATYLTGNETLVSDTITIKAVSALPLNVRATQSSSSAPVEVSWSPPFDGANSITGYRIYYGNGQSVLVLSVTAITLVGLKVNENYVGQNVSIRSESDELNSEFVNISVTADNVGAAMHFSSCFSEVGIAVGAVIVVVCLVVIVITVIVVLCLWRKSSDSAKNKNDFTVSANMAYGEVNLKPRDAEREYENPESILKPSGEWTEATATNMYEAVDTNNPAAPEYASTGETVTHHSP